MKLGLPVVCIIIFSVAAILNIKNSRAAPEAVYVQSLQPPSCPLPDSITLRIVTFNVQDLFIAGRQRIKRMRAIGDKLAELDPDIVGFQEAFIEKDRQMLIESLSQSRLKFHHYFPSGIMGSGLLIASAYPIRETFFHRYAASNPWYKIWEGDWWAGKGVALARLELPGGRSCLDIYNTHTQAGYRNHVYIYTNDYNDVRSRQMVEAASFINSTRTGISPAFFVGDMNCGQGSENFEIAVKNANLMRIMTVGSGVDHIFAVRDTRYVFEVMGGTAITDYKGLRLSDHSGYMSIIRITPGGDNSSVFTADFQAECLR